jgi:solute carrier family 35, member F1/2
MDFCRQLWVFISSEAVWRGQLVSAFVAGTGMTATVLASQKPNANFPVFMAFLNYVLLFVFFFFRYYYNSKYPEHDLKKLFTGDWKNPAWIYFLAAVLDVEANFMVTVAYNYTSITSIMLLDCFTIPCVMILSKYFLGAKYKRKHIFGTFLALAGVVCIVANDSSDSSGFDRAVLGDVLVLAGASLYACSNVLQEGLMKKNDREEYLCVMPGFAIIITLIQGGLYDLPGMMRAEWSISVISLIAGFVLCLFFFYLNVSMFLKYSDAALFNLSLLTSDVYAVVFSFLITSEWVTWLYILAFAFVGIGIYMYHSEEPPTSALTVSGNMPTDNNSGVREHKERLLEKDEESSTYNKIIDTQLNEDGEGEKEREDEEGRDRTTSRDSTLAEP